MTPPPQSPNVVRRLVVAVLVGLVATGTSYLATFYFLRGAFLTHSPAWTTRTELRGLAAAIEAHKEQKGNYPARLADIDGMKEWFKHDTGGQLHDRWEHPIQYSVTDAGFTLFSFGQDGQPGGEGDDADIHHDQPLELPSLHRFTFELPTQPLRWVSVLTGIGAAVIVGSAARSGWGGLLARAIATTIGAALIAFILSVIHIPSGH